MADQTERPIWSAFDDPIALPAEERTVLLGGKGAGLTAMTEMGLPVPPGFTLTTEACRRFLAEGWNDELEAAVAAGLARLEAATDKRLGDASAPLLVSVRSGAAVSMPGMMDTVLDVGMTDAVETGLARLTDDPDFAHDTHRRAILSFATVVGRADAEVLDLAVGIDPVGDLRRHFETHGIDIPTDPDAQVRASVRAVFESWRSDRAAHYRHVEGIDAAAGTAATIQAMVFGNLGHDSGTGVAFTRDPSTGERRLTGDFLASAQGEDVVAGDHTTRPLHEMADRWPAAWEELGDIAGQLEHHLADMVDIEFTVERGRLWMLQARAGKRSPVAALRMAIDMAEDPTFPVDRAEAVRRCGAYLEHPPRIGRGPAPDADETVIAHGLAASPGRGTGVVCLDVDRAVELDAAGTRVVLVRRETSPSDVHGMAVAAGLVTTLGGLVSHAAVVARSWGIPAIVGVSGLTIVADGIEGLTGHVGDGELVTVDGDEGRLLLGDCPGDSQVAPEVGVLRRWQTELGMVAPETSGPAVQVADVPADFLVLHSLRITGMATAAAIVARTGADPLAVELELAVLVDAGHARFHEARDIHQLLPEGRDVHDSRLAEAVAGLELDLLRYDEFLVLNEGFKEICAAWQLRDGEPNDHADAAHDATVVERLRALHGTADPVVRSFPATIPWTARYPERLAAALDRVIAGDPKALTGVLCDSYHDIWMELHEDLILVQGIDRAAEGST